LGTADLVRVAESQTPVLAPGDFPSHDVRRSVHHLLHVGHPGTSASISITAEAGRTRADMLLEQVTVEIDLLDGRTYLCCRSIRYGNALWDTLEARNHRLLYKGNLMLVSSFAKVFDLPKRVADADGSEQANGELE
jgi:hypothetical protein